MDDNQLNQTTSLLEAEFEKQRLKLVKILDQGEQMKNLQSAPEWEFFITWLEASKQRLIRDITSQNFINDHNGYIYSVAAISALNSVINGAKGFQGAYDRAAKKLNELNDIRKKFE